MDPETPAWAGAGHSRLSRVPRNARSHWTGISPGLILSVSVSQEGSVSLLGCIRNDPKPNV